MDEYSQTRNGHRKLLSGKAKKALTTCAVLALLLGSSVPLQFAHAQTATTIPIIGESGYSFPTTYVLIYGSQFGGDVTDFPYLSFQRTSITGQVLPNVAKVDSPVAGTNYTQWIISTRYPDAKWSDGQPINASDLAYSLQIYLPFGPYANESLVAEYGGGIPGNLKNVAIINSTSILVTLKSPNIGFAGATPNYEVYPWHYFKQFTGRDVVENTTILSGPGDSPYLPVNYTGTGNTLLLKANPLSPIWNGTTPSIPEIEYQYFTDTSSLVDALVAGTIDLAQVPYAQLPAVQADSSLTAVDIPSANQQYLNIRSVGYPWNETSFRQGLLYLINRTQIDSLLYNGQAAVGNAALMTATSSFLPSNLTSYSYNATLAQQLFAQAGLHKNSAGLLTQKNGTVLPAFTFIGQDDDPAYVRAEQLITSSWQSAGLQVTYTGGTPAAVSNTVYNDLAFDTSYAEGIFSPYPFRYLVNEYNWPNGGGSLFNGSNFESAISAAESASNISTGDALISKAASVLAQDAVADGTVFTPLYIAYNNKVFGNITGALEYSTTYDALPVSYASPNVLTSFIPASAGSASSSATSIRSTSISSATTSVSSTSSQAAASTSSTPILVATSSVTTSPSSNGLGTDAYLVIAAVVLVVVVVGATVVIRNRSGPGKPSAQGANP